MIFSSVDAENYVGWGDGACLASLVKPEAIEVVHTNLNVILSTLAFIDDPIDELFEEDKIDWIMEKTKQNGKVKKQQSGNKRKKSATKLTDPLLKKKKAESTPTPFVPETAKEYFAYLQHQSEGGSVGLLPAWCKKKPEQKGAEWNAVVHFANWLAKNKK